MNSKQKELKAEEIVNLLINGAQNKLNEGGRENLHEWGVEMIEAYAAKNLLNGLLYPRFINTKEKEPEIGDYYFVKVWFKDSTYPTKGLIKWGEHKNAAGQTYYDWDISAGERENIKKMEWLFEPDVIIDELKSEKGITFDDDFIRFVFADEMPRIRKCKDIEVSWPPPDWMIYRGRKFRRYRYSLLTDNQRASMTHVARGAEYKEVVAGEEDEPEPEAATKGYKLSKNYEALYEKVASGMEVVGFVDYSFKNSIQDHVCRDVCSIEKRKTWDINIGVRGISYGGVYYDPEDQRNEKECFISECERLKLEWVPGITFTEIFNPEINN